MFFVQAKAIVGSAPDHELLPRSGSKFQAAKAKAMKLWSEAPSPQKTKGWATDVGLQSGL